MKMDLRILGQEKTIFKFPLHCDDLEQVGLDFDNLILQWFDRAAPSFCRVLISIGQETYL